MDIERALAAQKIVNEREEELKLWNEEVSELCKKTIDYEKNYMEALKQRQEAMDALEAAKAKYFKIANRKPRSHKPQKPKRSKINKHSRKK